MEHELRCWPEHYAVIETGAKTCELRLADRPYQRGDSLLLREWEPVGNGYTGRQLRVRVTHVLSGGEWLAPGYVAMSIRLMGEDGRAQVQEDFKAVADAQRAEINQAREILSALEGETLVQAATDLVREEETTRAAYDQIHHRYWEEAVPEIAAQRARADAAERQCAELAQALAVAEQEREANHA